MAWTPTSPTHHCQRCGKALWDNRWPYAVCKPCGQEPCKHGNKPGDCGPCDIEGDFAYDAAKGN